MAESVPKKRIFLKVVIIGDSLYVYLIFVKLFYIYVLLFIYLLLIQRVGKTSLMRQYVENKFITHYKSTIGADFCCKSETRDDIEINYQVIFLYI